MPSASKYHSYSATWNNPPDDAAAQLREAFDSGFLQYLIFGFEIAPTTGTRHFQIYFWTKSLTTKQQVNNKFSKQIWLEPPGKVKGPAYWLDYCFKHIDEIEDYEEKEGEMWGVYGIPPSQAEHEAQAPKGQGARDDLIKCKKMIDEGTPSVRLMQNEETFATYARHAKFLDAYQAAQRRRRCYSKPNVVVYHGTTGTNKTRTVHSLVTDYDECWFWHPGMGQWFDGYAGQPMVVFEEYRGQIPYGLMLTLTDGYPGVRVPVKNGFVDWSPTNIYFTSPVHPSRWYPRQEHREDSIDQLLRRITTIHELS